MNDKKVYLSIRRHKVNEISSHHYYQKILNTNGPQCGVKFDKNVQFWKSQMILFRNMAIFDPGIIENPLSAIF